MLKSGQRPYKGSAWVVALLLLVLGAAGAIGSVGSALAQAEVFTNLSLPTISGTALEGQTLSEAHARWSEPPASYAYQWQRCNSAGSDCSSIPKARMQTYRLTAADVGVTIRVGEDASDSEGAVTPSLSEPTAVVQAQAGSEHGGGSGGGSSGGGSPPVSCCGRSAPADPAEIKTLLARQLAPSGKTASLSALLKHGGLRMSFKLPEAGKLVVKWYLVSAGAKLKLTLVASGQATLTAAKTVSVSVRLTAQGRKLLSHARRIHLEAKGAFMPKGEAAVGALKGFTLKR